MELEGLRGVAALVVVVYHFMCAFYPYFRFGPGSYEHTGFESVVYGTPLDLLFAGPFAVAIFFVLSGFVLSIGYFTTGKESIIRKLASKRYLRLMIPALIITIICFILIKLGSAHLINSAGSVTTSNWLKGAWDGNVGIFDAVYSGAVGIFYQGSSMFNNVLWTMTVEFIGSFMVFGFLMFFAKSEYRWAAYLILAVLTFNSWYIAFVIGMAIADAYALGWFEKLRHKAAYVVSFVLGGLLLGSYPRSDTAGTIFQYIELPAAFDMNSMNFFLTIGATLLLVGVLISKRLKQWLSYKPMVALGKYTFSLYLTHLAVLYTLTTFVFLQLHNIIGYNLAVLIAIMISIPAMTFVAFVFERYVDAPSIQFSKIIAEMYGGTRLIPHLRPHIGQLVRSYQSAKIRWQIKTRQFIGYDSD